MNPIGSAVQLFADKKKAGKPSGRHPAKERNEMIHSPTGYVARFVDDKGRPRVVLPVIGHDFAGYATVFAGDGRLVRADQITGLGKFDGVEPITP